MLKGLKIKNFALIDALEVSFSGGMTSITGETGAGKSILLGGLSLVLGKRAAMDSVRDSSEKCVVEAVFDIAPYHLEYFFEEENLDYDLETIIRREIVPSGKSRAFVNDTPVTLDVLEKLSLKLIDVHSQHETQTLLQTEYQFLVLDALAENKNILKEYRDRLKNFHEVSERYNQLLAQQSSMQESLDLKQFLYEELENAHLESSAQEDLESEIAELSSVENLRESFTKAIQILEAEEIGVLTQLIEWRSVIRKVAQRSKRHENMSRRVNGILAEVEDILEDMKTALDQLELNPERLFLLEQRLGLLYDLQNKHKVNSVEALISLRNQLAEALENTANTDGALISLKNQRKRLESELELLAEKIHKSRKNATPKLEEELQILVSQMEMSEARFKIELTPIDQFLDNGKDTLNFLFSANRGSEYKPLKKVVSGGELSRIMLAIKTILSRYKRLPTIIFDEIDTGVSGKVSDSIANIMVRMAEHMQVFTITHLPQVAARGQHHFKVYKEDINEQTLTHISLLSPTERVEEIALMLSGNRITPTALAHAKQLLKN